MIGYSFLAAAPGRLAEYAPALHQTIASDRDAAYREMLRARWAFNRAINEDRRPTPQRLRRLQDAVNDATRLHDAWVKGDTLASLAGALG